MKRPPWPPVQLDEYRYVRDLGAGAMGQVYLYEDTALKRRVAIKSLKPPASPDLAERFRTEAQAAARISHPNVVTVHRIGEIDGRPFMVSEFIDGHALSELSMPVAWPETLRIAIALARGLRAAHEQGVWHRDIKPANVMMDRPGQVKLCDFGLAKLVPVQVPHDPSQASEVSAQGTGVMGTPGYMSPEAWRGEVASLRSDLYSLGALLYELCTGDTPLPRLPPVAVAMATLRNDPLPVRTRAPEIEPRLAAIIDRCVQREPEKRFASADELLRALESIDAALRSVRMYRLAALALAGLATLTGLAELSRRMYLHVQHTGMADIPGGTFHMGSTDQEIEAAHLWCQSVSGKDCPREPFDREKPVRQVQISPFRLDRTEVTSARFADWLNQVPDLRREDDNKGPPAKHVPGRYVYAGRVLVVDLHPFGSPIEYRGGRYRPRADAADRPATLVTWEGAQMFCQAHGQRLPTEAEWEYAARGPDGKAFPWGNDHPGCDDTVYGRHSGLGCASKPWGPAQVGTTRLDRTPQGVFDLAGNVSEWVADRLAPYAPCAGGVCVDPPAVEGVEAGMHVIRGGNWNLSASAARSAARSIPPAGRTANVGFRCAAPAASR